MSVVGHNISIVALCVLLQYCNCDCVAVPLAIHSAHSRCVDLLAYAGTKPAPSGTAAATAAAWANAEVSGQDAIAAIPAALPDLTAVRQYLAAARACEVIGAGALGVFVCVCVGGVL